MSSGGGRGPTGGIDPVIPIPQNKNDFIESLSGLSRVQLKD